MRKKRGYNRETPIALARDYKLFAIACEGGKREPAYFRTFQHISSRIAVDVIEDTVSDVEVLSINPNKSAPKWVLDRAVRYIEKEGLNDEDELWFVLDIDRWEFNQLKEIADYCEQNTNWNIVLSNPCFEVWLYLHKKKDFSNSNSISCGDFKHEISTLENGGYHPLKWIPNLLIAIENSEFIDTNKNYFYPEVKTTKLYHLGKAIVEVVGKKGFEHFCNYIIPELLKEEINRLKRRKSR